MEKFIPDKCEHCGQTKNYELELSRGVANLVRAIGIAIGLKGVNAIHPMKELVVDPREWSLAVMLEIGAITPNMNSNMKRATAHGLLAKIDSKRYGKEYRGNYLLTTKGAAFLRGRPVPKVAIVSKVTGHNERYLDDQDTVTCAQLLREDANWKGISYDIVEGRVVRDIARPAEGEPLQLL